jgi:hypothetical protein
VLAFNVTKPGAQKVTGPAAVMLAEGAAFTVTATTFDVVFPQLLETIQL